LIAIIVPLLIAGVFPADKRTGQLTKAPYIMPVVGAKENSYILEAEL
jgi:hypothetical protein